MRNIHRRFKEGKYAPMRCGGRAKYGFRTNTGIKIIFFPPHILRIFKNPAAATLKGQPPVLCQVSQDLT
jgi:hypothetical protein